MLAVTQTHGLDAILFPLGDRLSTWLALLAFCLLAAWRSDKQPLLAAVVWLAGFETAYQIAAMILHTPAHIRFVAPVSISLLVGAPMVAVAVTVLGHVRVDVRLLALALGVFVVWLATGFHVNTNPDGPINPLGEVLNEASKTLWAVAYLLPLVRTKKSAAPPESGTASMDSALDGRPNPSLEKNAEEKVGVTAFPG